MTNQAILLIQPEESSKEKLLVKKIKNKIFLHYQLSYLSDNLFKKVILVSSSSPISFYKSFFGEEYLGMEMIYINMEESSSQVELLMAAMEYAFVFDAFKYFRINFSKADDFRRMRDAKILLISSKASDIEPENDQLFLDEKGKIIDIKDARSLESDCIFTNTWHIKKDYFIEHYKNSTSSIWDIWKNKYKTTPLYSLACRQYYIEINSLKDLEIAKYEFTEYYYQ